jgi:hypothetical protein
MGSTLSSPSNSTRYVTKVRDMKVKGGPALKASDSLEAPTLPRGANSDQVREKK